MLSTRWSFGRYLYLLVSITAVGLLALSGLQYYERLQTKFRTADNVANGLAREISTRVKAELDETFRVAALIARRTDTVTLDNERCNAFLGEMLTVFPNFTNLLVHGIDGRMACLGQASSPPGNLTRLTAFEQARQGQRALSGPIMDRNRWIILATEPVFDARQHVIAVLTISIDLSALMSLLHVDPAIHDPLITLTDTDGIVLARSNRDSEWTGRRANNILPTAEMFRHSNGPVIQAGLDDLRRIYGFALVPEYGWRVYTGIPEDVLLADAGRETIPVLGIAALIVATILLLATILARRMTVPVNAMATALRNSANGRLDSALPEHGPAELANLAHTFNVAIAERNKAEGQLQGVINSAMDAVVTINEKREIVLLNPAAETMFGYTSAELIREHVNVLIPGRFHHAHDRHIATFAGTGVTSRSMGRLGQILGRRKNGDEFPIEASISQLGKTPDRLFTAILRDVTERQETEDRVRRLNRVYAVLSGINMLIVRSRDRQQLLNDACRIAIEQGGFGIAWISQINRETETVSPVAWAGLDSDWITQHPTAGTYLGQGLIWRALDTRHAVISNDILTETTRGGAIRAEAICRGYRSLAVLPLIVDENAIGTMSLYAKEPGFFTTEEIRLLDELAGDISFALKYLAREQQTAYLTYYDTLTGLPNRTLFLERVSLALRSAQNSDGHFVLALGDVRRFRMINETLGRQSGDAVLRQIVERLINFVRNPENLSRISGDIFAIFLPAIHDLTEIPHRIDALATEVLHRPININGQDLNLAFTAGIAVFPQDGNDAETLFRNAEAALKKAKASGENYLFYAPEMNARVAESLLMESKLRRALELNQFVLYYQPKVDVRTRVITGLEALIRWRDPELGLVPPIRFISLLEECGLILDVGRWALEQAVRDYKSWTEAGIAVPRIAVNLSSIQLRHKEFIDTIVAVVDSFGRLDVALDLELTESVVMENVQEMVKKLQIVRSLGVEIAIDDFGTGYSSLSYIAKLPINTLKIDRSFIIAMTDSEYSLNIVTMIIQLAHTLHLKVVAEGVDDEKHVQILANLGCDQMQGYLISKPIAPEEIPVMLGKSPPVAGK